MKFYDITQVLGNDSAFWPGDTPFRLAWTARLENGDSVNLSRVELSLHNGTHADAPAHYGEQGLTIDQVPPERYIGPARLVFLEGRQSISRADVEALGLAGVERLLIRTGSCPDRTRFHQDFTWLEPEAVRCFADLGVRLIGTDSHSVDPFDSADLPAHHACGAAGILILENLNLWDVPPGEYELIALPLKLAGADGSPIRAVLRELASTGGSQVGT